MFTSSRKLHFVGIGGIGMSAIAEILLSQGFSVSGSDLSESENTEYLRKLGAEIYIGHSSDNIKNADVVVYSSAVHIDTNPETTEAVKRNIPLLRRAEMLAEVTRLNYCLAISGTHGKTTTTSMCGLMLMEAGFEPTVIVGGRLGGLGGTNARLGKGNWTVVEADEYDRSFLQLMPTVAVINNIEPEHMDIYENYDDLKDTFIQFTKKIPFYGLLAVCIDDAGIKDILNDIQKKIITFGLSRNADVRADDIVQSKFTSTFNVIKNEELLGSVKLNLPGIHNVRNALAAIAVGTELNVEFEIIAKALELFTGVNRRFELKGMYNEMMIIDDYAHHPTEIKATLSAARAGFDKKIIAVFQPHTYSRTAEFYKEFASSFDDADILLVMDVYAAREKPIDGITGKLIADTTIKYGHKNVVYAPKLSDVYEVVKNMGNPDNMLITLGAGDVWKLNHVLVNKLNPDDLH